MPPVRGKQKQQFPAISGLSGGRRAGRIAPSQKSELLKASLPRNSQFYPEKSVMYAVLETGGKQYRVAVGDVIRVEKLEVAAGDSVNLDNVLMVADGDKLRIGAPNVAGASVTATVKAHGRADKIRIFKMRRRKHYRKNQGHRQHYTEIEIVAIK
jgi:large subunit ribosomal protein L21